MSNEVQLFMRIRIIFIISIILIEAGCATNYEPKRLNTAREHIDVIEQYQLSVAFEINKNWRFVDEGSAYSKLETNISFKVMPNGEIKDIRYTGKSGNKEMDDAAYAAIMQSTPVKPFPKAITKQYIEMGINFHPVNRK